MCNLIIEYPFGMWFVYPHTVHTESVCIFIVLYLYRCTGSVNLNSETRAMLDLRLFIERASKCDMVL